MHLLWLVCGVLVCCRVEKEKHQMQQECEDLLHNLEHVEKGRVGHASMRLGMPSIHIIYNRSLYHIVAKCYLYRAYLKYTVMYIAHSKPEKCIWQINVEISSKLQTYLDMKAQHT